MMDIYWPADAHGEADAPPRKRVRHFPWESASLNTKTLLLLITVGISGCNISSNGQLPPHLWSDHKQLTISVQACAQKATSVLSSLGFSSVVRNGNFSYGNLRDNRAAVKCIENQGGSFVYFAVAGSNKESVEKLRNEIAWKF
jgi:hypothetical protein